MRIVLLIALALIAGCGSDSKQPAFADLHAVNGVVSRGGQPVKGGTIQFKSEPNKPEFLINSEVGADGTFTLTTVRTTDSKGERKPGAPAGSYKVTYIPVVADQTTGNLDPITLPKAVTVEAKANELKIELPGRKK